MRTYIIPAEVLYTDALCVTQIPDQRATLLYVEVEHNHQTENSRPWCTDKARTDPTAKPAAATFMPLPVLHSASNDDAVGFDSSVMRLRDRDASDVGRAATACVTTFIVTVTGYATGRRGPKLWAGVATETSRIDAEEKWPLVMLIEKMGSTA